MTPQQQATQQANRAVIYVRKSTNKGLEQKYNSLDAQEDYCRSFIRARGWECTDVYADAGISGKAMDNRPGLRSMIEDAKKRKFGHIVVYRLDRLNRKLRDFLNLINVLELSDVSLDSASEPIETKSAMGRALISILGAFAEMESDLISNRTREKSEQSRARGLYTCGSVPLGYKRVDGRLYVDPENAAKIVKVYEIYSRERSASVVKNELNRQNVLFTSTRGKSHPWSSMEVCRVLHNPLYCGLVKGADNQLFVGQHEPLVTREQWDECQAILKENADLVHDKITNKQREHVVKFPLHDILTCAHCGHAMRGRYCQRKDGPRFRYYVCPTRVKRGTCTTPNLNANEVENFAAAHLMGNRFLPHVLAQVPRLARGIPADFVAEQTQDLALLLNAATEAEKTAIFRLVYDEISYDAERGCLDIRYKDFSK